MPWALRYRGSAWLIAAWSLASSGAVADLRPDECLVIFNAASEPSREIVEYYIKSRGIPAVQRLSLTLPIADELSREDYVRSLESPVREVLTRQPWGQRIRCLVTCYGVPLRVGRKALDPGLAPRVKALTERLATTLRRIDEVIGDLERLAGGVESSTAESSTSDAAASEADSPLDAFHERYQSALRRVDSHALRSSALRGNDDRKRVVVAIARIEGLAGAMGRLHEQLETGSDVAMRRRLRQLERRITERERNLEFAFAWDATPEAFDAGAETLQDTRGLIGVARALSYRVRLHQGFHTESALDNELALVLSEPYALTGWRPNPLCVVGEINDESNRPPNADHRTLMVARLDGPSPDVVRRMIDDAIAVEKTGLTGTAYIDARGLKKDDGYAEYDLDLIGLADFLRERTSIPVVLDIKPGLFRPGSCPNAALYCGWYSLEAYIDAFEFTRGAVAYHLASFELVSLRDDEKNYWCKGLLNDGAAATLGATDEPFLQAFPRPSAFFRLLLTGRFTLVECFAKTSPYVSWRVALVGDPLYNPFREKPAFSGNP